MAPTTSAVRRSLRPLLLLALLALAGILAWRADMLPGLRRGTRRFLEPPTEAEMNRAPREAARPAPAYTPQDAPVSLGAMVLWIALPLAGVVLLIVATGRSRHDAPR